MDLLLSSHFLHTSQHRHQMVRYLIAAMFQIHRPIATVVTDVAVGATGLVSIPGPVKWAAELLTAHHRCDVPSELCYPDAKLRRWTPPLVTRFGVILQTPFITTNGRPTG